MIELGLEALSILLHQHFVLYRTYHTTIILYYKCLLNSQCGLESHLSY